MKRQGRQGQQEKIGNMLIFLNNGQSQEYEEISKRIKDLSRKVNTARRFGRNPDMLAQLTNALNTYRMAIRDSRIEEWHKNNKKLRGEPDLGDLVNID